MYLSKYSGSGGDVTDGGSIFTPAIGELDETFGGTGKVTTPVGSNDDQGQAVAIQSDGKIVVAGYSYNGSNYDIAVVRYNTDGSLDTSFGGTGIVTTTIGGSGDDQGQAIAIQSDGKIVVAGYSYNVSSYDIAVVRYETNGNLDTSFGVGGTDGDGIVTTNIGGSSDDRGYAIAIQSDGKIVVAGFSNSGSNYDIAVVRYETNGNLDTSFGGTGKVTIDIGSSNDYGYAIAIQSDGKIIVAGYSDSGGNYDITVVRYNTNGNLDTSFGVGGADGDGKVTTDISNNIDQGQSIAIQSDGKIVVAGYSLISVTYDIAVVRYKTDGSLDTSFGGTGKVTTPVGSNEDRGYAVAIQSDGNIVVVGYTGTSPNFDIAIVRYDTNGNLDPSFGGTGKVTTPIGSNDDQGQSVAIQSDGKIVVAGFSNNGSNYDKAVVRYR